MALMAESSRLMCGPTTFRLDWSETAACALGSSGCDDPHHFFARRRWAESKLRLPDDSTAADGRSVILALAGIEYGTRTVSPERSTLRFCAPNQRGMLEVVGMMALFARAALHG